MITFNCPACQKRVSAPDAAAGKRGACPGCKQAFSIPGTAPAVAVASPAAIAPPKPAPPPIPSQPAFEVIDDDEPIELSPNAIVRQPQQFSISAADVIDDDPPPARRRRSRNDDEDDHDDDDRPRGRRRRAYDEEDDDDDLPRRVGPSRGTRRGRTGYAICYACGADAAERVTFTWWGGIVGPALLTHVRCRKCQTTYNGNSGKSNDTAIGIYFGVGAVLGLIIGCMGVLANSR